MRNRSIIAVCALLVAISTTVRAADNKPQFLPAKSYFETLLLDPTSNQLGLGVLGYSSGESGIWEKLYIPILMGVNKPVLRWEQDDRHGKEVGFDFLIMTQYDIARVNRENMEQSAPMGTQLNADYRISGWYNIRSEASTYRIRLFHQSSHLGDDFVIRKGILGRGSNPMNYEQLDITRSVQNGYHRHYYGFGYTITPHAERKRIAFQLGYYFSKPSSRFSDSKLIYGADVKIMEQHSYRPSIKLGIGYELGESHRNPPRLILEYYNGNLPYSRYEHTVVQLLGIGLYINTPI
ncbi:DUF1207 domain-containing protein [Candidatus Neomarinimicrobiota bacterium]